MSRRDLFVFQNAQSVQQFHPVLDRLRGGRSIANLLITDEGTACFTGVLTLHNGAGFACVRSTPRDFSIQNETHLILRARGDGKRYQVHLRTTSGIDGISHRAMFIAPRRWSTVVLPFTSFQPTYRGRLVQRAPPMDHTRICTLGFMIADGQEGPFALELAWVRAGRLVN